MKRWNEPQITELSTKFTKDGGPGAEGDFVTYDPAIVLPNGNIITSAETGKEGDGSDIS